MSRRHFSTHIVSACIALIVLGFSMSAVIGQVNFAAASFAKQSPTLTVSPSCSVPCTLTITGSGFSSTITRIQWALSGPHQFSASGTITSSNNPEKATIPDSLCPANGSTINVSSPTKGVIVNTPSVTLICPTPPPPSPTPTQPPSTPNPTPSATASTSPSATSTLPPSPTPTPKTAAPVSRPGVTPTPGFATTPTPPFSSQQTAGNNPSGGGGSDTPGSGGSSNGGVFFTLAALLLAILAFALYLAGLPQSSLATKLLTLVVPAAILKRFDSSRS